jgi:hypothetical protein
MGATAGTKSLGRGVWGETLLQKGYPQKGVHICGRLFTTTITMYV